MKDILTPLEIIQYLRLDKNTVYKLLREGKIKSFSVGQTYRIKKEWLDEFMNNGGTVCNV